MSRKFDPKLTPSPLCDAKMAKLPTTVYIVLQSTYPKPPTWVTSFMKGPLDILAWTDRPIGFAIGIDFIYLREDPLYFWICERDALPT